MKTYNKFLSLVLVACMLLAMIPAEAFAEEGNPGVLSTDIIDKTFYVGKATEFTITTIANNDSGKMVRWALEFSDPEAVEKLEYQKAEDGNWCEFDAEAEPNEGFEMADGASRFRVTFNKAGTFTLNAALKMADGSGDVAGTTASVEVSDYMPSQLTTDIGGKAFKVGMTTEFSFETVANDDAGAMVVGTAVFSDPEAVEKLEYYEVQDNQWYELVGDFGPEGGFPMSDARSRFRVTFKKSGDFSFTASMKMAEDGAVLCSVTQSFHVSERTPAVISTDAAQQKYIAGEATVFTVTTTANDYAGTMSIASLVWSDPDAVEKLEYQQDGKWYELKGDYGPAEGFALKDETITFRVTFRTPGKHTLNVIMKRADSAENVCATGTVAVNVLAKYKVNIDANITDAGVIDCDKENVLVEGGQLTFRVTANQGFQIAGISGASSVEMEPDNMAATVTVIPNGDVTVVVNFVKTHTVTVIQNENGTVVTNPALVEGTVKVVTGSVVKFVATPNEGYRVAMVVTKKDGKVSTETFDEHANVYSTDLEMDGNYEITVTFAVSIHTVTVESNGNGKVSISDPDGRIEHNGQVKVMAVPDYGYEIKSVTVNDEKVTVNADGSFEITGIKENQHIIVVFGLKEYDVTVNSNGNGSVTTSAGNEKIKHGSDLTVNIKPAAGCKVTAILVNGQKIENFTVEDLRELALRFEIPGVEEAQNIEVTFAPREKLELAVTDLFDEEKALRCDGMTYIYAPNSEITFSTDKTGIVIYDEKGAVLAGGVDQKTAVVAAGKTIGKIEIYNVVGGFPDWNTLPGVTAENPLKLVVDTDPAKLDFVIDVANENGYHKENVVVGFDVEENEAYSGIASITYEVRKNYDPEIPGSGTVTQSGSFRIGEDGPKVYGDCIVVDAAKNADDQVVVIIEVKDRAGNVAVYTSEILKINASAPVLQEIKITNEQKDEALFGYYTKRTMELTILDRSDTFDEGAAKNGVKITYSNGVSAALSPSMISCSSNGNVHTLRIEFVDDGRYDWRFSYQNKAGLDLVDGEDLSIAEGTYQFVIDGTAPTGTIKYQKTTWSDLVETLTFGIWSNSTMKVTAEGKDATSELKTIMYYKSNSAVAMTDTLLEAAFENKEFRVEPYEITSDEKYAVYARIVDNAGNVTYIGTDGLIFDNTDSVIDLVALDDNANDWYDKENDRNIRFYKGDVKIGIEVSENAEIYSGIKSIDYQVIRDNDYDNPTQSGNLYTFTHDDSNGKPKYEQLKGSWSLNEYAGEDKYIITDGENKYLRVDAALNNHDNVKVVVTVVDNAGNKVTRELLLTINIDKLSADILFTQGSVADYVTDGRGYFQAEYRTALITVKNDRASSFDEEAMKAAVRAAITAFDGDGNPVENAYEFINVNHVNMNHIIEVQFKAGANFTWVFSDEIRYVNKAGNEIVWNSPEKLPAFVLMDGAMLKPCDEVEGSAPYHFTVDQTAPTGHAKIDKNIWDKVVETLSFGLFSKESILVEAIAKDETSPVTIQYYKTDKLEILTRDELDILANAGEFCEFPLEEDEEPVVGNVQYKRLTVENEGRFVVYLKITDQAGNYSYVSTDGAIVDGSQAVIGLDPAEPDQDPFYNKNENSVVDVEVKVEDVGSGIQSVTYWVISNGVTTQEGELYNFGYSSDLYGSLDDQSWEISNSDVEDENGSYTAPPSYDMLKKAWSGTIAVDRMANDSNEVEVHVKVLDNAGNPVECVEMLAIDVSAPEILVDMSGEVKHELYFNTSRTATITIKERNFDPELVTVTVMRAESPDGEAQVVQKFTEQLHSADAWTTANGTDHTADITIEDDGYYTFAISCLDTAGNANAEVQYTETSAAATAFCVDKTVPTELSAEVTVQTAEGETINSNVLAEPAEDGTVTFAFEKYYSMPIVIKLSGNCDLSGMDYIEYKKVSDAADFNENTRNWILYDAEKGIEIKPNEKLFIFFRVWDKAGNNTIRNTTGIVVDDQLPEGTGGPEAPEIDIVLPQPNENNLYNGNVKVDVVVTDPRFIGEDRDENGVLSGLNKITYHIEAVEEDGTRVEEDGVLFDLANNITEGAIYNEDQLVSSWSGHFEIRSDILNNYKFNSNNVVVRISATDNAGNRRDTLTEKGAIRIDTSKPEITVNYDKTNPSNGHYYNTDRVADIMIHERNLDLDDVQIIVKKDGVEIGDYAITEWEKVVGTGNQDDTVHRAKITYSLDGDYEFSIACTDQADWENEPVQTNDQDTAFAFTIDQTKPVIRVSYSNNNAANGKYFDASRTATVSITEHNFKQELVTFTRNASRGGTLPNIVWTQNGDTHTATIHYTADGDYTFDVTMNDLAGNSSGAANYGNSVAPRDFVVDTTYEEMITIGGVENGKAYGYDAEVIPTIQISDINLESKTVTLVGVQKDTTIDLTQEVNALLKSGAETVTGTIDLFEVVQELDGIYTLKVSALDKAGNPDSEEVVFTVNRFGSVYTYNEYLMDLIKDGGAYVTAVNGDLVIDEYNADKLLSGSLVIEITCDGKPLENVIYDVTPEINDKAPVGTSGWYQYKYTISKDNFAFDGVYKVTVSSRDATGNTPENSRYEQKSIIFYVDSTQAEISSVIGLEKPIINATEHVVKYNIYDTMGIRSIQIFVDDAIVSEITDFGSDRNNYSGSFTLKEQTHAQKIRFVVEDLSGNITDTDAESFTSVYAFNKTVTVSTNILVRWYANQQLFWGSIGGFAALIAALWAFLAAKRKKKEEAGK